MTMKPRQPAPPLEVQLLDGTSWRLAASQPKSFTLIVVYRGLHCPLCKIYLNDLQSRLPDFEKRGVDVVAISADSRERAEKSRDEWNLSQLRIGYALPIPVARDWELFISHPVRDGEPQEFTEPGLFLVKPDGTLFFASRGNAPWGRPPLDQVLRGIDAAIERNSPARGEA